MVVDVMKDDNINEIIRNVNRGDQEGIITASVLLSNLIRRNPERALQILKSLKKNLS